MTRKPRLLYSVPTGDDVDRPPVDHSAATEPASIPDWPFPLVDLSSLTPTAVEVLMDRIGEFSRNGQHLDPVALPPQTRRRPRPATASTLRVRVALTGIDPPIWRTLEVSSDLTLDRLHPVLQAAFGWWDQHLHTFVSGEHDDPLAERYLTPFDVSEGDEGVLESAVELSEVLVDPGDTLHYLYDFGDHWALVLELESVAPRQCDAAPARCVDGGRAAAPEDCGGVWGYQDLLDAGQVDQPELFDPAVVNDRLSAGAGNVTRSGRQLPQHLPAGVADLLVRSSEPLAGPLEELVADIDFSASVALPVAAAEALTAHYRWLLRRVGSEGLTVTGAGYLKPTDVSAAVAELFPAGEWPGAGNREAHALPVRRLRVSAQKFGLLRKSGGRLLLTRLGATAMGDPLVLLDRIAGRLPLGTLEHERDAGTALLIAMAAGGSRAGRSVDDLVAEVMTGAGWRNAVDGPISPDEARNAARPTRAVLDHLSPNPPFAAHRFVSAELAEFARLALLRPAH